MNAPPATEVEPGDHAPDEVGPEEAGDAPHDPHHVVRGGRVEPGASGTMPSATR